MNAVLAASIFHFGTYTVGDAKRFLKEKNIPARLRKQNAVSLRTTKLS